MLLALPLLLGGRTRGKETLLVAQDGQRRHRLLLQGAVLGMRRGGELEEDGEGPLGQGLAAARGGVRLQAARGAAVLRAWAGVGSQGRGLVQ